jgi:hypothetical protein
MAYRLRISTKFQAPNDKQAPMNEIQNFKQNRFGHLGIGILDLFGICDLDIGIYVSPKLFPRNYSDE